jgi:hypothetical protein
MQSNKLRMAIRSTAAVAVLGVAGQAGAVDFNAGDYEMSIYGYARLNATYDIDEAVAISTRAADYSKINHGGAEDNEVTGHFGADAVQSRLGFKVMTPQDVKINLETDFRGDFFRIRHAYAEYNGVLMGRYWSNYNSFVGNTSQLDFDGVPGSAGLQSRISQIRYTTGPFSVSVEAPRSSITGATVVTDPGQTVTDNAGNPVVIGRETASVEKDGLPTFTARIDNSIDSLSYSAAVLVHQNAYDTGTSDESSFGFGAFAAAKLGLSDMISVQGALNYSDGANSYLYRSGSNFYAADAYVGPNGDVENIAGFGGTLGVSMKTAPGASVNVVYGIAMTDLDDAVADGAVAATAQEANSMAAINYQWAPVKNVNMGVQYAFHQSELNSGDTGSASRLHFAAQYNF